MITANTDYVLGVMTGGNGSISCTAQVAQLGERNLAKVEVAGSCPVLCSRLADSGPRRLQAHLDAEVALKEAT